MNWLSKLRLNEINFNENEIIVEVDVEQKKELAIKKQQMLQQNDSDAQNKILEAQKEAKGIIDEATLILNRARDEAQEIIEKAKKEAFELQERLNQQLGEIEAQKNEIIEKANVEAKEIIEKAQNDSKIENEELIKKLKEDIEVERVETIKNAYEEGHKDGLIHIQEELEEKIANFNNFCAQNYEIRDKILKSANKDILDLILNITKKILLKELDVEIIDKIIKNAILLLEKKENITIILSQKYARLLFDLQKRTLSDEIEFNFEDFKQYENFDVVYNPSFDDDTIIIENLKERYDASVNSQLDVIVRNIYDNTQNGKLDLENYENEAEWIKWNC